MVARTTGDGTDVVRVWRPPGIAGVVLMSGTTTSYDAAAYTEYVFGVVSGSTMLATRGRARYAVGPGELVAWDPSAGHRATGGRRPWSARIAVVELAAVESLVRDQEEDWHGDPSFRDPVVTDPPLVEQFLRVHRVLDRPGSALEHGEALSSWLRRMTRTGSGGPAEPVAHRERRDGPAVQAARDYLEAHPTRNITLDELTVAAGVGKFRLIRSFTAAFGVTPHRYQLGTRLAAARRALEGGADVAAVAAATGFVDQSHLHRHFRRSTGMTPAAYQRATMPRRQVATSSKTGPTSSS